MPTSPRKKHSRIASIFGFLILVGAIASILFFRAAPASEADVAARLKGFSDYLSKQAASAGREVALSYASITTEGVGYDRYVVINGLHIAVTQKGETIWALDTDKVSASFDPLNDLRMIFKFPEPISFTQNGIKNTFTMPAPLKFGYFESADPKLAFNEIITLRLPAKFTLDSKDQPPLTLSYDGLPEVTAKHSDASHEQEQSYELRNITVQSGAEQKATIGAFASTISEKPDGSQINGNYILTVSDFTRQLGTTSKTCSLTSHIGYTSSEPLMNLTGLPEHADIAAKINKLVLACDDFSIKFEGDFAFAKDDTLPTGAVVITIENLKPFLASDLINDQTRQQLTDSLPAITGKPLDSLTNASMTLKRDKDGAFQLGAISLQDAGITMLSDLLSKKEEAAPVLISPIVPAEATSPAEHP